ncbi:rRNA maturation RNase YbeY [Isosphaeraceae bacterium EP7]
MPVDPDGLARLARRVLVGEGVDLASISIVVVDDPTIRSINARHLQHDWPTDVVTFPLSDPDETELCGEVVVSAEMAATTAQQSGFNPSDELALYVVHGLLHLCGLDDTDDASSASMRRREGEVLSALGLVNTFPLVGRPAPDSLAGRGGSRWPE